jgi:hypothetical protein
MASWCFRRLLAVVVLVALSAQTAIAAVDLTGDWYLAIDSNSGVLMHIIQNGTSLSASLEGNFVTGSGTIDPDTGAFTLTFPPSIPPVDCGGMIQGQADMAGLTFTGTGLAAFTPESCMSVFCACTGSQPITVRGSRSPCGNGVVDGGEACDSGNLGLPGDCCNLGCTAFALPAGATCLSDFKVCTDDICDAFGTCTHPAGNAGTVCRPAADVCDLADTCDGVGTMCPADAKQPDGTPCSDGLFCNGDEAGCQAGVCQIGAAPCPLFCDEISDACVGCPSAPQSCRAAAKSLLKARGTGAGADDKLLWKFIKGASTSQTELSDPTTTTAYEFCIYAGTSATLVAETVIPGDATKWKTLGSRGYKYKDTAASIGGIRKVKLKGSADNTTALLVAGRGTGLPDLPLPLSAPVTVQLTNADSTVCWGTTFSSQQLRTNDSGALKAKAP